MIQIMNDIWIISQEAILIINLVTVVKTNKPSFQSPISYLQMAGGGGEEICLWDKYGETCYFYSQNTTIL